MGISLQPLKKIPLYEQIAEQIKNEISSGRLQPGEKLPSERDLAAKLGVSRVPVREALGMLRLMGIVETKYGSGAVVKGLEKSLILETIDMLLESETDAKLEITEARLVLEVGAVKLACLRRTENDLKRLRETIDGMKADIEKGSSPVDNSLEFHSCVLRASKNKVMFKMAMMFADLLRETRKLSMNRAGRPQSALEEHIKILDAIERKDPATAAMLMEHHLMDTQKGVEAAAAESRILEHK